MATAGYSGTPLIKKLGIKDDAAVLLINAPENYFLLLEKDISSQLVKQKAIPDFVHVFTKTKKHFEHEVKQLKKICLANPQVIIWVSWYKKSSGIPTDLSEETIRQWAIENNLVDIKVCAVSIEWSGLKLVVPKNKR